MTQKYGFTLAEVLVTLGIIGIVAAMTLPTVINKYQKSVAVSKLKRVYSLLTNATQLAINDYGPSQFWAYPMKKDGEYSEITLNDFFQKYYAPYFKSTKVSSYISNTSYKVHNFNGQDTSFNNLQIRGSNIKLNDGMCIYMWSNNQFFVFTADLNCEKPPNKLGHDVFDIAELYWEGNKNFKSPPRLYQINNQNARKEAIENCKNGTYSGGSPNTCFAVFVSDGWEFKDDYPW